MFMKMILFLMFHTFVFAQIILPESFQSDFKQMVTNPKGKVLHYEGKVYFSSMQYFKWVYLKPTQKEVCTDGKELLVVDHDLEQVSAYYISKGLDISKVLQKATLYRKNIYLANYDERQYTIQLDDKNRLQSIAYYDELDNKVQIIFIDMKYTKTALPKKKMQCNYPKAYDIIRG